MPDSAPRGLPPVLLPTFSPDEISVTKPRPRKSSALRPLCGEPGPGDGVDPRDDVRQSVSRRIDRKTLQLCGQVRQTLQYVLSGECGDELLRSLDILRVDPAPDAARLLVSVTPLDPADPTPAAEFLERLQERSGQLRAEVARSISRRKAPLLSFQFVAGFTGPTPEQGGDQ